ncbi:PfkB family carbohydrate kinase [Frateuria sp. YIM B11624]|uniref:PfkB family carbohydrate kinase n=1 Tax=Frateuria sp. YIM B11624 TaxID=3143185 RepID=UPI003C740167
MYTYLDRPATVSLANRNRGQRYVVHAHQVDRVATFAYIHELASPVIYAPSADHPKFEIKTEKAVVYGLYAGEAAVTADYAVYDPQNAANPHLFSDQGSKARHLAVVLNQYEAAKILGEPFSTSADELARKIAEREGAEVVVMKAGPIGALVLYQGHMTFVPSYQTSYVFKIGSGDIFVAAFAQGWLEEGLSPHDAAERASRATAFYVQERRPATAQELREFRPSPVPVGEKNKRHVRDGGDRAKVYLAGPFFTMGQLWVVEEALRALSALDLEVLSPYHRVGPGEAGVVVKADLDLLDESDLVLAIGDGMDAGTVFEVGYAKAQGKPVVFYAENEVGEDLKMFQGSGCHMVRHFATAIYRTVWEAMAL